MEASESLKQLEVDPELEQSLREALNRNAKAEELADILAGAGLDQPAVEELVAHLQQKRGATIGIQELDLDELDMVAGGVSSSCSQADDCSDEYKTDYCTSTQYASNQKCDSWKFCALSEICDTYSHCTSTTTGGCYSALF